MHNLYNELSNSLERLLDNDVKISYQYSSIVVLYLKQLLSMCSSMQYFDISSCNDVINELKEYLEKEYNSYEKLLVYSKDSLFSKADSVINSDCNALEMLRHRNKLQFTKNIFSGYMISSKDLNLIDIPNMRYDIFSVIVAFIHIKTFKNIQNKIDNLSCETQRDTEFVNALVAIFNKQLILKSCNNDLLEVLTIYNDIDIDKIPDIDINLIIDKLKKIYRCNNIDDCVSDVLFRLVVGDISVMCQQGNLVNRPQDIFDYLYFTTRLEIILVYMNKTYLLKLYEYCKSIKFNNKYIYNDINNKIKRRIITEN